jgi:hypothetical protein
VALSVVGFDAPIQGSMGFTLNVQNITSTKFNVDVSHLAGFPFAIIYANGFLVDTSQYFPYIYLWHNIPLNASASTFIINSVTPLSAGTGYRAGTTTFTFLP